MVSPIPQFVSLIDFTEQTQRHVVSVRFNLSELDEIEALLGVGI